MALREELEEKHEGSEVLEAFDEAEGAALVDLGNLVLLVDAELTHREHEALKERVFQLTVADGSEDVDILADGRFADADRVRELVENEAELERFIDERVSAIEGTAHREAALRVLATLSYADGLEDEEEGICHTIGAAFGFDADRIEELLVEGAVDVWELGGDRVD